MRGKEQEMRRLETSKRFAGLIAVLVLAAGITAASALAGASDDDESPRSGALHVTKECSQYNGQAGSFCTITSSSIRAIKPGMRVVYLQPLGAGVLDSDIVLSSRRRPAAFGHVVLDLATAQGRVTFSGGTGKFRGFHADVAVSVDASGVWHWNGTYSFTRPNDDD
jgi:hypothetical protein